MKRLFFSLYFAVVLAIAFIGWSTEFVWQYVQTNSDSEIAKLVKLSNAILLIENIQEPSKQELLSQMIGEKVSSVAMNDVAWLTENKLKLQNRQPVMIYDELDELFIYLNVTSDNLINDSSNLIKIGPINLAQQDGYKQRLLMLISYLMLALAIGLWSRPLWRDLRILQQATEKFGLGEWQTVPSVSKKSVIAPVVETFRKMSSRISRLIEEQKSLSNAISHELRTPLARLKFSLALLNQDAIADIQGMRKDVNELENLVDEMLSYSRLESITDELNLTPVNMNELLENLIERLQVNSNKTIEFKVYQQFFWLCDGHYLERAIQNLLTNAIYYAKTKVVLTAEINKGDLEILVEDDGRGIKEQDQSEIFKPFVRLDKSREKKSGGFGLGLAIVKRVIEKHRGFCSVSTSILGGAKFTIILPSVK